LQDPSVTASAPSLTQGTSLSSVQFTFSKAMNTSSFDVASDVNSFTSPGAVDLLAQITGSSWNAGGTVLTVSFNPQSADGVYQMSIGPNILAADNGHAMNQDGDANIGEAADDRYVGSFRVDSV